MKKAILLLLIPQISLAQHQLQTIKVFGHGESALFESVTATSVKTSTELQDSGSSSVGDAVQSLPGVNSTGFNTSSTRPIIRGLEGERIRVLVDQLGTLDVSGTSADHVVPINPLLVDSIEVVRGPISLLYGSSAIGGVVNIVSDRSHDEKFEGLSGSLSSQLQTVNNLKNVSAKLDYGVSNWIFHFDGNYAHNQNLKVPTSEEKITNSQGEQSSFNFGATHLYNTNDFVSLSYTNYINDYGVVAEEDVTIETEQDRLDLSTKNSLTGFFEKIETKTALAFYEHSEIEDGGVGTVFEKTGLENRIDLRQKERGNFSGTVGLHTKHTDLTVEGDEAFLPSGKDLNTAAFSYQEWKATDKIKLSLGNRFEFAEVSPESLEDQSYFLTNASIGTVYQIDSKNSLSSNLSYNERNPNSQELYSNGAHIALGIFELGDSNLKKEQAFGLDLSYKYTANKTHFHLNLFVNRFENYITLLNSNIQDDTDESGVAGDSDEDFFIYNYTPTNALLYGAELTYQKDLIKNLSLEVQSDVLVGKDLSNDIYLPRLTPPRVSLKLKHTYGNFSSQIEVAHNMKPLNLGLNESDTDSYTLTNIGSSYKLKTQNYNLRFYAQVRNLFDEEARNHSSFTKGIMQAGSLNAIIGAEASF